MEASSYSERPDVLAYRVKINGERLDKVEDWRRDVDSERSARGVEFKDLHDDMTELKRGQKRVVWALVTLALTIAGSSVGVVLALVAHHA